MKYISPRRALQRLLNHQPVVTASNVPIVMDDDGFFMAGDERLGNLRECYIDDYKEDAQQTTRHHIINICQQFTEMLTEDKLHSSAEECLQSMMKLLVEKNKRYGDSAVKPLQVFSQLDNVNSIFVRLDDKLGRIKNAKELRKNDVADIIGYLVLLCVANGWTDFEELID